MGEIYSLTLPSKKENIPILAQFVSEIMKASSFDHQETLKFQLAVEEACMNIALHAYEGRQGTIRISAETTLECLKVDVEDEGPPFDPTEHISATAATTPYPMGRWGIPLIRALSDGTSYERLDGKNVLHLIKRRCKG